MINVELIVSITAIAVALITVFIIGMRMGRLEKDVEIGMRRMEEMLKHLLEKKT